ncbi:MFS transporter [Enterococcus sp. 669A]|uniref:MFS transporter n=1 Tax=Candidatus Enterococcus moelleringii TaxID=2815325 RepID=A0ABS3L9K4_9ENTE|nr:MFS transporter [Enterococcus sp. 669A]
MKNIKIKAAVLSQSFVVMAIMIASTVLANIAQSFPDASLTAIQMVMTFGMVASFPATLLAGVLGNHLNKKHIVLFALAIMLVGGLLPVFLHDKLMYIYASSLLIGVGQGTLMTTISNISTELFEGEERSQMYGMQTAFQNGGSVVMMMVAGMLAKNSWSKGYWTFGIILITMVIVLLWLPSEAVAPKREAAAAQDAPKAKVPVSVYMIGLLICLFCIGYATFSLNASLYIASMGLGDSATVALAMSLSTGAGVVGGFVFPAFFKVINRFVLSFACAVTAVGYLLLVISPSIVTVFLAAITAGIGFSLSIPLGIQAISETATPEQMSSSMGSYMAFTSVGAAASPLIINALAGMIPNADDSTVFLTSVVFLAILTVITIVWSIKTSTAKNASEPPVPE